MPVGLIVRANGTKELKTINGIKEIYNAIGCSCIEGFRLSNAIMYLDEEGKYKPKNTNVLATSMALQNGLMPSDYIVGDVVIFGDTSPDGENDGNDYNVPFEIIEAFNN
jgi:hypothetical protein